MSNPKYKLTTPCPCCNSQVTVESYTDQPPNLTAVPSPVDDSKNVKPNTQNLPPKPTGVAEAMTNIVGATKPSDPPFAYSGTGYKHAWGSWGDSLYYETAEQRRIRQLEDKVANLQRNIGTQSESLVSAHTKLKSFEQVEKELREMDLLLDRSVGSAHKSANSAHKRISELDKDFEDFVESINRRIDDLAKDSEAEKWRNMMQVKADKLNEITTVVYLFYEKGNPHKLNSEDVYSRIKDIILRPEPPVVTKGSWTHDPSSRVH